MRIYAGADAQCELYEDEDDGENYERGVSSITPLEWNEKRQTLTIGKRIGHFTGMLDQRMFNIVRVGKGYGVGEKISDSVDATVEYEEKGIEIKRKQ